MGKFLQYYEKYHETYGERGYGASKVLQTSRFLILKELIEKRTNPGHKILDVGSGDCGLASLVPQLDYTGIDCNPALSNGRALKCDLESEPFPLPDKEFNIVICSEVLEHLYDLRDIHKEVHRVMADDGVYIVTTPNFDHVDHFMTNFRCLLSDFNQSHLIEHIRMYNLQNHINFLHESGFQVIDHFGADAHYSGFFAEARKLLPKVLNEEFGVTIDEWQADKIFGKVFREYSHTIGLIARKK